MRESKIQYNPTLSVKDNAKRNGVSEAAIRYYIKVNNIDRRFDRTQNLIADCRKYLKKHPNATKAELHEKTGHSLSTIRRYWDAAHERTSTEQFKNDSIKKFTRTRLDNAVEDPSKIANGKPLASELLKEASDIIKFAEQADTGRFREWLLRDRIRPLVCIGNGGKYTTYPALLYQMMSSIGKSATPLEFATMSPEAIGNSKILILSNGGANIDIKYATKRAAKYNKNNTACFTFTDTDDNIMVKTFGLEQSFVFKNDFYDGFISIRSKILTYALLYKAFSGDASFADKIRCTGQYKAGMNKGGSFPRWSNINHFNVLYGSYGEPVAHDIESTMVEGGIASVQLTDYRNFCHGRFIFGSNHCANKKVKTTDVCTILLISPREEKIAREIREKALPENMPVVEIRTELDNPLATIQLLIDALTFLFNVAERCFDINPNSPKNFSAIDKRIPKNSIPFAQELSRLGELHYDDGAEPIPPAITTKAVVGDLKTKAKIDELLAIEKENEEKTRCDYSEGELIKTICGGVFGDISGSTREKSSKSVYHTEFDLFPDKSRPTDDSVLTVAIADWLLHKDTLTLSEALKKWGRKYPKAGYGGGFRDYFKKNIEYSSDKNGAAMRVSPVAVVAKSLDEALSLAKETALPTHNTEEGIKGAQAIAAAIYLVREGVSKGIETSIIKSEIKDYIERTFRYDLNQTIESIRERSQKFAEMKRVERTTGYKDPNFRRMSEAAVSVPMAIIAFLEGNSYEEVLRIAISLGGDADTIACMASSISVHLYGVPQGLYEDGRKLIPNDMKVIIDEFDKKYLSNN